MLTQPLLIDEKVNDKKEFLNIGTPFLEIQNAKLYLILKSNNNLLYTKTYLLEVWFGVSGPNNLLQVWLIFTLCQPLKTHVNTCARIR